MVLETDLYDKLNILTTSTSKTIRERYFQLSLTLHPDKTGQESPEYTEINYAYSILSDPELRLVYDIQGMAGIRRHNGRDPVQNQAYYNKRPQNKSTVLNMTKILQFLVLAIISTGVIVTYKDRSTEMVEYILFPLLIRIFHFDVSESIIKTSLNISTNASEIERNIDDEILTLYVNTSSIETKSEATVDFPDELFDEDISDTSTSVASPGESGLALQDKINVNKNDLFEEVEILTELLTKLKDICVIWSEPFVGLEAKLKDLQHVVFSKVDLIILKRKVEELRHELGININKYYNPISQAKLGTDISNVNFTQFLILKQI